MEMVTLTIVCADGEGEFIANQMINSDIAQIGLFSWGTNVRKANEKEVREVRQQME